jgi:hypothetical protein
MLLELNNLSGSPTLELKKTNDFCKIEDNEEKKIRNSLKNIMLQLLEIITFKLKFQQQQQQQDGI